MSDVELDPLILAFYSDRFREHERLTSTRHGQLEFLRTQELLRGRLPAPPAAILDVGGGTGVHARWLSDDGYQVHLIDPVPSHVQQAGHHDGFSAAVGDTRALQEADDSVDVTLLLGPLYHLTDAADRSRALAEVARVTRPGGLVAAAAISRYAALLEFTGLGLLDEDAADELQDILATGRNVDDPEGFTNAYFHRAEQLALELRESDLIDISVLGIEGPAAPALDNAAVDRAPAVLASAVRCARLLEADPALTAASPHLLALGRVPSSATTSG